MVSPSSTPRARTCSGGLDGGTVVSGMRSGAAGQVLRRPRCFGGLPRRAGFGSQIIDVDRIDTRIALDHMTSVLKAGAKYITEAAS
jgi:hypothetical protein